MARCETCRFWHAGGAKATAGRAECRRFPPQIVLRTSEHSRVLTRPEHYFPMTLAEHWCGEHDPVKGI